MPILSPFPAVLCVKPTDPCQGSEGAINTVSDISLFNQRGKWQDLGKYYMLGPSMHVERRSKDD